MDDRVFGWIDVLDTIRHITLNLTLLCTSLPGTYPLSSLREVQRSTTATIWSRCWVTTFRRRTIWQATRTMRSRWQDASVYRINTTHSNYSFSEFTTMFADAMNGNGACRVEYPRFYQYHLDEPRPAVLYLETDALGRESVFLIWTRSWLVCHRSVRHLDF